MTAKILTFPTKQFLNEEIKDQYGNHYSHKANFNSIKNTTNWLQNEKYSNSTITITISVGFIQFVLFIAIEVLILVLCFFIH